MNSFSRTLPFLGLIAALIVINAESNAAPTVKPSSQSKSAKAKPSGPKWEYCYMVGRTYENEQTGVTAYLPGGKMQRVTYASNGPNHAAVARLLNLLGEHGFEVVAYQVAENGHQSWTLKRRK